MPYCRNCGALNEPAASFCESCGSPMGAPLAPEALSGARPPRGLRPYFAGALLLSIAVAGGIGAYLLVGGGDSGDGDRAAAERTARPTAAVTVEASAVAAETPTARPPTATSVPPTREPTATMPPAVATVAPPSGFAFPEEAIGAFLLDRGATYAGDCEFTSVERDVGSYCSMFSEERPGAEIYAIGLAFSEPDTWLLLDEGEGGWTVADWAELIFGEPPPW